MLFRRKKKRRALVLGLDGVPKSLIERFARDGTMPFLGEVFAAGTLHQARVCLPEVSNVNWTSFMTGANPGEHGVFGFTDLKPRSYTMRFPSFPDVRGDTLWDEIGREGKRCLVVNQPGCYPVRSIPGAIVSGFVAVDLKRAVAPPEALPPLQAMNYKIDVETQGCHEDPDKLFAELDACLDARQKAVDHFLNQETWDFAEIVITGTDRLQHFHWPSCEGEDEETERARAYYNRCDAMLRRWTEQFYGAEEPEGLFLLSDHGFCKLEREFNLNVWLKEAGYLAFTKEPPESYGDLTADSRAFAMDPGRVYVHRQGRYPDGPVTEDEAPELIAELRDKLEAITHDGAPVFERVWEHGEIYEGPLANQGPDLLCTPRRGLDVKGAIRRTETFSESRFTGMHTWDDAFFWAAKDHGDALTISDLRPIIAGHFRG
ncbi:MAG: alkaline phosphatase family protein [Candidatus Hydrogenedentota bacterium]